MTNGFLTKGNCSQALLAACRNSEVRSSAEVLEDHLRLLAAGDLEEDLVRNYSEEVVLIHQFGVMCGIEGVRRSSQRLQQQLQGHSFEYESKRVHGDYALLIWRAESTTARIEHGVDSFVIRGGRIILQTVHFVLRDR